jgi:protein-tyrosine-phosphatase
VIEEPTALTAEALEEIARRLSLEFEALFGQSDIERMVDETLGLLEKIRSGSIAPREVEIFTRNRLQAQGRVEGALFARVPSVIFVCVHNAGRSQMSAGWARHLGGDRLLVFSGGSAPGEAVNPRAVTAMAEVGIDISGAIPLSFTDEIVQASDVVVTMGCGDACPYFPNKRYLDWELSDPHAASLDEVREVRDEIERRVRQLLVEMGVS